MGSIKGLVCVRGLYYYQPPQVDHIRPPRISLRTRDPAEAIERFREMVADGPPPAATRRQTLSFSLAAFLRHKLARGAHRSPASGQSARTAVGHLIRVAGDVKLTAVTEAHIVALRAGLAQTRSRESVHTYLRALRAFFCWCQAQRMLLIDPMRSISIQQPRRSSSVRFLSREDRDMLISACQRKDLRLVLVLGFHCGLRISEILAARNNWISATDHGGILCIRQNADFRIKNDRSRIVPLDLIAAAELLPANGSNSYLIAPTKRGGRARLRWDPRKPFRQHATACGFPSLTMHDMRHTFASLHAQAGTPLYKIARWLGDNPATVERHYADLSGIDADIHRTVQ